jgi:hypothetical protein
MKTIKGHRLPVIWLLAAAIPVQAATPLVDHADVWRYHKGNTGAWQPDWKTATDANLDATWLPGNGGFGFAGNAFETSLCQTLLNDMRGNYSTVAFRKSFQIGAPPDPALRLTLTMDWDDGFIAWLDGVYLVSENAPNAPAQPPQDASATASRESSRGDNSPQPAVIYDLGAVGTRLGTGTHVLSVIGLNSSLGGSGDFIQIADLQLTTNAPPSGNCVRGLILADTTWRATASPIVLCGDVTVGSGVRLTIEPGAIVQFDSGVNLTVANGAVLLAEGSETNRIRFTRSPANTASWGGITIHGEPGSPETRITYTDIDSNGSTAIHSSGGTVFLDHIVFGTPDHQYISLDGSSFIVSDCVMPTGATGFELAHGTAGIKAGGHGIFLRNFFGGTLGYNDVVDFTGGKRPGPIVHFIGNVFSGSQDDGVDLDGTDAWIEGNIFLHVHRNGNTPDSSAAISGGSSGGDTSRITSIGNLFFDCDNAVTAKQGNFYTLINNTIVHTTHQGGIDFASGVINVRDTTPSVTTFALGCHLEDNVIVDAPELMRNYDPLQTSVTWTNNILPLPWNGPGGGNSVTDPKLAHIPNVPDAVFTNWADAQILKTWFALQPGSPALGTGPNGSDLGGVIPPGVSLSGEPPGLTEQRDAVLTVGPNVTGPDIPKDTWPDGCGYTHYKWRLDGTGTWSGETPIRTPITLAGLAAGPHFVEVSGKRDSGPYQDDPLFGTAATTARSRTWTVAGALAISGISIGGNGAVSIAFEAQAGSGYTLQYRNSLTTGAWQTAVHLDPLPSTQTVTVPIANPDGSAARFFRIATP